MIDRSQIGVVSEPRFIEVEKGQLRFFAKATGETNPIYFDEQAARRAGYPSLPAPPTYAFTLYLGAPATRGGLADLGIDVRRVLHGEQSFTHHRMIYAGDLITIVTRTQDIYQRKAGALEFVVQDTTLANQHGEVCVEMRTVIVVRNQ